jgi:hypothetical protein
MSETSSQRSPALFVCLLLFAVAAMGVTSLAIHPPHPSLAFGKSRVECQVSGKVTSECRPVTRGTICFSCVMLDDSMDAEVFPDVTVRIEDGTYVISGEDGLVPGRYQVTIRAQQFGDEVDEPLSSPDRHLHRADRDLILGASGSPTVADFEL